MIAHLLPDSFPLFGAKMVRANRVPWLLGCLFIFTLIQLIFPLYMSPSIIRGDGVGYFAYLNSLFFDRDLNFRDEYDYFASILSEREPPMTNLFLQGLPTASGLLPNHWPIGPAILWLPFFLLAHFFALIAGAPADGYSLPYQLAISFGSATYAFIGLLLIYRLCRNYFTPVVSSLAVLLLWFATSLTAYMYFMTSMSHACSLFAASLFIYLWCQTRQTRSLATWAALGASAALMMLQRQQDALFVLVVMCEVVWIVMATPGANRWKTARELLLPLTVFAVSGIIGYLPQLIIWRVIYGRTVLNVHYESTGNTMDWASPHWFDVLFSSNHGLISWTPVVGFGLIGLIFLWRRDRLLTLGLAGVFLAQLYLLGGWGGDKYAGGWDQGAAFGGRVFVSCGVVFALGLAALLDRLQSYVRIWQMSLVGGLFVIWNYILLFQYGTGMIPRTGPISWLQVWRNIPKILGLLSATLGSFLA